MKKTIIRLTENDLHSMIKEAIDQYNHYDWDNGITWDNGKKFPIEGDYVIDKKVNVWDKDKSMSDQLKAEREKFEKQRRDRLEKEKQAKINRAKNAEKARQTRERNKKAREEQKRKEEERREQIYAQQREKQEREQKQKEQEYEKWLQTRKTTHHFNPDKLKSRDGLRRDLDYVHPWNQSKEDALDGFDRISNVAQQLYPDHTPDRTSSQLHNKLKGNGENQSNYKLTPKEIGRLRNMIKNYINS